ncbi:MAG: 23S rRNA (adenine(2503)-C(2))-methyltransferase RlmN, partial [Lachnospiraceae bacterium]|nr:23S rRNA (adenine(2503)-C(2))-methyltransferase RlmN [Lachnospiraceae bacterium]
MDKKDIKSFSFDELNNEIVSMGEKSFRAKQIYDWLHVKLVRSFDEMTNLSNDLRSRLKENYNLTTLEIVRVQESKIDGTRKYLFKLP